MSQKMVNDIKRLGWRLDKLEEAVNLLESRLESQGDKITKVAHTKTSKSGHDVAPKELPKSLEELEIGRQPQGA